MLLPAAADFMDVERFCPRHMDPRRKHNNSAVSSRYLLYTGMYSTTDSAFPPGAELMGIQLNTSAIDPAGVTALPGYTIAETLGLHDFCIHPVV